MDVEVDEEIGGEAMGGEVEVEIKSLPVPGDE